MSRYFTTLAHTAALLLAVLLFTSGSVVLILPAQPVYAQQTNKNDEEKLRKKLTSTKSENDCKSKGGYVNPSYTGNEWKGEYCVTEGEYTALQQKGEFNENSETICRALGIENCDDTITKAYDECASSAGNGKIKRDEIVDCVSKKSNIDKETFENGLRGKKTINKSERPTCVVSGMGWVICPIMLFLASMADGIQASFEYFLTYETLTHSDSNKAVRDIWGTFRNIANLGFVIVFLFIVFSQLTGYGVSNYGIKQALPRLIVLSIIVNLSFPIAIIAVDISNIVGASVKQLIESLIVKDGAELGSYRDVTSLLLAGVFTTAITGAISIGVGGLIVKGMFYGLLALLLPVLIIAVTALGVMFIILIARHALMTILVAIAPLALMLQLLPNTKTAYHKWKNLSITLLTLYPIISVIFGLAKFTSSVIYSASPDDTLVKILALGVQAIPFFIVPYLIKAAGATSGLGGLVSRGAQSLNKRVSGSTGQFIQRKRKEAAVQMQGKINQNFSIKKGDSRLRRLGKRSMAAIVGGSAYRARQAAMKDSFVELQLARASRDFHIRDAAENPRSYGFKPGDNLHAVALGQAARLEAAEEEEDIKAQGILIQERSNAELDALMKEPDLSATQKVALLHELTNRNHAKAISYMQILLTQNTTGTYSSTVAHAVADTLRQHAPGLVSEQTLKKIITRPAPRIEYTTPQPTGAGTNGGGSTEDITSIPKTNTIADKVAEREKELEEQAAIDTKDTSTSNELTDKIVETQDAHTLNIGKNTDDTKDDLTAALEGSIDLVAEINSNLASGGLSVEDASKLSPEIIEYIRTHGSEDANAHLRDALRTAIADKDTRGKIKNIEENMNFALEGKIIPGGHYETFLTNRKIEQNRQSRLTEREQKRSRSHKKQKTEQ